MAHLLGVIGFLLFCAGLDLLWQSRNDALFWLSSYLKIFRSTLRGAPDTGREVWMTPDAIAHLPKRKTRRTFAMVLGVSLAFVGPLLVIASLVILLYPKL